MNIFKYILYPVIIGLLGSGLTANAMLKQGVKRVLPQVAKTAGKSIKTTGKTGFTHMAKEFATEAGKEAYQQGAKRAFRGNARKATLISAKNSISILNDNKNKTFRTTPIVSIKNGIGNNSVSLNRQNSEFQDIKEQSDLIENKDIGKEQESKEISDSTAESKKELVSAGKAEVQSKAELSIEAKEIEKIEKKKQKNAEKAVERRKKDDKKLAEEKAKVEDKKAELDANLAEKFQKQIQLRRDQEARAQQKLEQPVNSESDRLVPVRNRNNDSATQLVRSTDSVSLVEVEKLLTEEVVINITRDNPTHRLEQLNKVHNNQLAVKNNVKDNQVLMFEQTGRGEIKRAVLLVPTKQVKNILKDNGIRFRRKGQTQIIMSPTQAKNALEGMTPKQPALPEAKGQDLSPVLPRNYRVAEQPLAEKPQKFSVIPMPKNVNSRYPMGSAGRTTAKIDGTTLGVKPTAVAKATKPANVRIPKDVQPKRRKPVITEKARVEVDGTGLKAEAKKIEFPEQERLERERLEREREEEQKRMRDKEREEENKERERLEKEEQKRKEEEEQRRRREEEQRRNRDREREETEKEINKRNRRTRRGEKQRARMARVPKARRIRATRVENRPTPPRPRLPLARAAAVQAPTDPIIVPPQPAPTPTITPFAPQSPDIPKRDPRVSDYRKIIKMARKPIAELVGNSNLRMKIKWAHNEPGIERMLHAFNRGANMMTICYKDVQLPNDDAHRQYSLGAISTSAICFESVKKGIVDDISRALIELGFSEEDTGLLVFRA